MSDVDEGRFKDQQDLQLDATPEPVGPGREGGEGPRPIWPWVGLVAVVVTLIGAGIWYWGRPQGQPAQDVAADLPLPAAAGPRAPLGPAVEPLELPPLDLTDALVRELLRQLSSRPEVAAWLATDGLIRNFAVSVDNVADGKSPARHLRALAPQGPFRTATRGSAVQTDPRSFERYNGLADAVDSLDPAALAKLYAILKPRIADAYRELGHPEGDIDAAVERAIVHLIATPGVPPGAELRESPLSYRYAEDRYERLSDAQKQLARMGPRNQELVQAKLRAIARELGVQ